MTNSVDNSKRRFLTTAATVVVGGAGAATMAIPFVMTMAPSARAQAAGAPVEVPIDKIAPGQQMIVEWRKKPVWILRRTEEIIADLPSLDNKLADPNSDMMQQPEYCKNELRAIRDEILVLVGVCTHLGCSPTHVPKVEAASKGLGDDWKGGFFCPCHGSKFDFAGRVYKGMPAPTNLAVPPYRFEGDNLLIIGEDTQGVA
jgi:ubiquinol-cytochrome c reductase iron-sulfur subunit